MHEAVPEHPRSRSECVGSGVDVKGLGEIVKGSLAESNPPAARQASLSVVRGFRQLAH